MFLNVGLRTGEPCKIRARVGKVPIDDQKRAALERIRDQAREGAKKARASGLDSIAHLLECAVLEADEMLKAMAPGNA